MCFVSFLPFILGKDTRTEILVIVMFPICFSMIIDVNCISNHFHLSFVSLKFDVEPHEIPDYILCLRFSMRWLSTAASCTAWTLSA